MRSLFTLLLVLLVSLHADDYDIPAPPEGTLKYSVTVTKFDNEAGWSGKWSIGDGMATIMTDMLNQSGWFITLGDDEMRKAAMQEQDFNAAGRTAGGKKTAKMGRMTPAQLLLRGSITHVQETGSKEGGLNFMGVSVGGDTGSAEINFTIYMIDSQTGQVVASKSVIGESGKRGFRLGYHGSKLGGLTGGFGGEDADNVGQAAQDAVGKALTFMISQLDRIAWEGSVMMVKGKSVIINRGEREGVKVGTTFNVGNVEELVDPDTGEVLDVDMSVVGSVKVSSVKEKIAYADIITGGNAIAKGMSVLPLK
ncbi:MAG: hypothetical protein JXK05_10655 [Campylobacterales bacterium]|nr:hypothetical protein [Campylobacterales bacterium]